MPERQVIAWLPKPLKPCRQSGHSGLFNTLRLTVLTATAAGLLRKAAGRLRKAAIRTVVTATTILLLPLLLLLRPPYPPRTEESGLLLPVPGEGIEGPLLATR